MAYPGVNQIPDPATRLALEHLWKFAYDLQNQLATLDAAALKPGVTIEAGNRRVSGVANPLNLEDAVNLQTLLTTVQSQIKGI